jgi:hypothetical protein
MNGPVTLFDLFGVAGLAQPATAAAGKWPAFRVKSVLDVGPDPDPTDLMEYLQSVLAFRAVRPAASGERTGLTADVVVSHVGFAGPRRPLVLAQLPNIAFVLEDTGTDKPARLFVTKSDTGVELVVEALPVEIRVPSDLLRPAYDPTGAAPLVPDAAQTEPFDPDHYDSLAVTLRDIGHSSIVVRVRVRMTEEGDFVVEPAVPISIGPCRFFLDLPCRGLHDLNFVPSPRLAAGHSEREQALEWARHPLDGTAAPGTGVLTVRTVDLDETAWPIAYFLGEANRLGPIENHVELVLEDLALPLVAESGMLPFPSHGLAGLRRRLVQGGDPNEEFGFGGTPVDVELTKNIHLLVEQLLVQSPGSQGEQFAFVKMMLAFGAQQETTLAAAMPVDATTARVADPTVFKKTDGLVVTIDPHTPREERIGVARLEGDTLMGLTRGIEDDAYKGTVAQPHDAGAIVKGPSWAFTLDVADDWTVMVGVRAPESRPFFELFGTNVRLIGAKVGASIKRLLSDDPALGLGDKVVALVDLEVGTKPSTPPDPNGKQFAIKFVDAAGEPVETILRDFGWYLGDFTAGADGVAFPEGIQIVWLDLFRLIVEDISWVTETNGAQYLSLTGGLLGRPGAPIPAYLEGPGPAPEGADADREGLVIRVHRLRFLVAGGDGDGDPQTGPRAVLLDGVSLSARWERLELSGYGMIAEYARDGSEYREWAVGVVMKLALKAVEFVFAAEFLYGKVTGQLDFTYLLAGVEVGPIPICGVRLLTVRALVAKNMRPNLPPPDGNDGKLRIHEWYKEHGEVGVSIPVDRNLDQTGWVPEEESFAFAIGVSLAPAVGTSARFEGFAFFHKSPEDRGFLFVLEAYLFRHPSPVLFGGVEVDGAEGIVSAFLGGEIGLDVFFDTSSALLQSLGKLTGTAYLEVGLDKTSAGCRPWRFALGQLDDQATWLSLSGSVQGIFVVSFVLALCFEMGNDPDQPNGVGVVASIRGGRDFYGVRMQAYATVGLLLLCWRNASEARSFAAWLEAAGWVEVARVLRVGMQFRLEWDRLGPGPTYQRIAFDFVLDLPWWMPDATLRFEYVEEARRPEAMAIVSTPVVSAEAIAPGTHRQVALAVVGPAGGAADEGEIFSIDGLRGLAEPQLEDAIFAALEPAPVDSVLAIDFGASVDDRLSIGETTPQGAGTQQSNELAVTYELVELEIRRRPRFGPGAGVWTTLLAPGDTLVGATDGQLSATFASEVSVRWDRDMLRGDELDPRRLLVNAAVPYTFATANAAADEAMARGERRWPCCTPSRHYYLWHELTFADVPPGVRAPAVGTFTESSSTLHWVGDRPPVVAAGQVAPAGLHAARVRFDTRRPGAFAVVGFDEPAAIFEALLYWPERATPGLVAIEAYDGLTLVEVRELRLSDASPPPPLRVASPSGITSIRLRYGVDPKAEAPAGARAGDRVEIVEMRYRTVREEVDKLVFQEKCRLQNERGGAASGRFAWLPNHDYEIAVAARITLTDERAGAQEAIVRQRVGMRTKGLPGLNAVARTGNELEPYVESVYPSSGPHYGAEPVAIAFDERFNILAPVDRTIAPGDAAERAQLLEWALTVDRIGASRAERLTSTSEDWIVAHRDAPATPGRRPPRVLDATILESAVREAGTRDALRKRYETVATRPSAGCGGAGPVVHSSQVLSHAPIDPAAAPGASEQWAPRARFRASLRRKDGPFVLREPFEEGDAGAFSFEREDGGAAAAWVVSDGRMRVASPPAGVRCYAVFGDESWDHVGVAAAVDPEGGAAGIALGVRAGASGRMVVLLDEGERVVRIVERGGGATVELASAPLPEQLRAPYALEVTAFDDAIRAAVGDVTVEAPRGAVRAGRLALVGEGGGAFHRLSVEPLEAYRVEFETSRFATFEEHIASFRATTAEIRADAFGADAALATVESLYAETATEIDAALAPGNAAGRQRLFDRWAGSLALPLRRHVDALEVDRFVSDGATALFLLESPEPLAFDSEVTVALRSGGADVPVRVVADGSCTRALLLPVSAGGGAAQPVPGGACELTFTLDRVRYRAEAPDDASNYRATASIVVP